VGRDKPFFMKLFKINNIDHVKYILPTLFLFWYAE